MSLLRRRCFGAHSGVRGTSIKTPDVLNSWQLTQTVAGGSPHNVLVGPGEVHEVVWGQCQGQAVMSDKKLISALPPPSPSPKP